ncbi:PQ-loop domain-containing transporter [Candidatus Marinamargulisbacteria bacterium]|nr:hypothetical protein [bacterium]MDA7563926.1 PQ-loop domain-containing transporter [Candidatus Marinamargulisbacteria bacterium]MDG2264993.1 PQ-loop domain-containing transporter [Candidatus Marinamargulisbacteria bacterium]|tara:strand:+ start:1969 stop:2235 length:267 start_codon:yes stop_codon:yes gene_type:complete
MILYTNLVVESIGYCAGACIAVATAPQLWKTLRSKRVGDINTMTPFLLTMGSILFVIYGSSIGAWPIVASNTVAMIINGALWVACLRL